MEFLPWRSWRAWPSWRFRSGGRRLQRTISQSRSDRLEIDGAATLDGTLRIALGSAAAAANFVHGASFVMLRAASLAETFDQHQLPALPGGLSFAVAHDATSVRVNVVPEPASAVVAALPALLAMRRSRKRAREGR